MQTIRHHLLIPLAVSLVLWAGGGCHQGPPSDGGYGAPSPPRELAAGTLIGVSGGLRLLRVENPSGTPGCEGAPSPDLAGVRAGGGDVVDPAPRVDLTPGGNWLFTRPHGRFALVIVCEGFVQRIWLGTASGTGLSDLRTVPDLHPLPGGQLIVTGWSQDGTRLLAVAVNGDGLDGHDIVAIDPGTGAIADTGENGYWADDLAGGRLVVDQGDHVLVGGTSVPVAGVGPGDSRHLAVDPAGRRVAVGTRAGLVVIDGGGRSTRWAGEPVRGTPAWSPDGRAIAYPTAASGGDLVGPLHVVTAGAAPTTAAPATIVYEPARFADEGPAALVYTVPGPEAADPAGRHVAEVTFGPRGPVANPTVSTAYTAATFDAWRGGDRARLERLATPAVAQVLAVRPPRADDGWGEPRSEGAAGSTYTTWDGTGSTLTLRVLNEAASTGADHAVVEAFFGPSPSTTPAPAACSAGGSSSSTTGAGAAGAFAARPWKS